MNFDEELIAQFDKMDKIGVVDTGSTNTTLNVQFLKDPAKTLLVGEMVAMKFSQDSKTQYAFCQIITVKMTNPWHQDSGIRSLVKLEGKIENISDVLDTYAGNLDISSVFYVTKSGSKNIEAVVMGTVPPTGTIIYRASENIFKQLFMAYSQELFYLGNRYGSKYKIPFMLKHFGKTGVGEAYHIGVFGKTGSGKSVLAKMLLCAYARHKNMTIFVIDPQGEFTKDLDSINNEYKFSLRSELSKLRGSEKNVQTPNISQLALDDETLFFEILKKQKKFFDVLSIATLENINLACDQIRSFLGRNNLTIEKYHSIEVFRIVVNSFNNEEVMRYIYRSPQSLERMKNKISFLNDKDKAGWKTVYKEHWLPVANLFNNEERKKLSISQFIDITLPIDDENRPKPQKMAKIVVIDLSEKNLIGKKLLWNSEIKNMVIQQLIDKLQTRGMHYYQADANCNTLVIIDEAHRLAPNYVDANDENAQKLRYSLIDSVRTTRKYGIGWMFISQTVESLNIQIIKQLRINFFGFGLGYGDEGFSLANKVGIPNSSLDLYKSFIDPHAALNISQRSYPFMLVGPASPLAASGSPIFFDALKYPEEFFKVNFS